MNNSLYSVCGFVNMVRWCLLGLCANIDNVGIVIPYYQDSVENCNNVQAVNAV